MNVAEGKCAGNRAPLASVPSTGPHRPLVRGLAFGRCCNCSVGAVREPPVAPVGATPNRTPPQRMSFDSWRYPVTDYLDTISAFVAELAASRGAAISAEAREAGRWILLDTLGGMLASSTLPESQGFARLAQESSPGDAATLVGFDAGASARYAAMVNATTACSFETDEGNRFGG